MHAGVTLFARAVRVEASIKYRAANVVRVGGRSASDETKALVRARPTYAMPIFGRGLSLQRLNIDGADCLQAAVSI